jgi:hypothetical protein
MLYSFGKGEQIELRAKRDRAERGFKCTNASILKLTPRGISE